MMKTKTKFKFSLYAALICLMMFAVSCTSYENREQAENFLDKHTGDAVSAQTKIVEEMEQGSGVLPKRFQNPSFLLEKSGAFAGSDAFSVPVGADISSNRGPVTLRDILKRLAVLKQMNVSWADDVDQKALVDVDIRAEDDYYKAIENILRQLDYFYDIQGNSIVVKYRDTQTFHIAMPFLVSKYSSGVGGDVMGSGDKKHKMKGLIELVTKGASKDSFNIWANIEANLDELLRVSAETEVEDSVDVTEESPRVDAMDGEKAVNKSTTPTTRTHNQGALGYYMVDKPVGLITVTAPRTLLARVESYINNLKKVVYRQISIEAKIVEVTLSADNRTGLDWSGLLGGTVDSALTANVDFSQILPDDAADYADKVNQPYPFTLNAKSFPLILDAMKEQGHIEVLANPKISVMNGQPAMISVGKDYRYIETVESTVSENIVTLSVETGSVVSGLGLSVVATIMDDNEVILHLTPVTSELMEEIEYKEFGTYGAKVGLPKIAIREMSSTVRVKNGEMLVVGGLIDSINQYSENKVVGGGDIPILKKLFAREGNEYNKKEMVILLRPVILN